MLSREASDRADAGSLDSVRGELDRILESKWFAESPRSSKFLRYIVEQSISGTGAGLKEYMIGLEVFERGPSFDPRTDTIVRVQARRLRERLAEYYANDGGTDPIIIEIPKGRYTPEFRWPPAKPANGFGDYVRRHRWLSAGGMSAVAVATVAFLYSELPGVWRSSATTAWSELFPAELRSVPLTTYRGDEREPAVSPDGSQVAFIWDGEMRDNYDIYVRDIDGGSPIRLTADTAAERCPEWAPDARHLAFLRPSQTGASLLVIPSAGGEERLLAKLSVLGSQISWSPDGRFLAVEDREAVGEPEGIFLVSAETGEKRRLTKPPAAYFSDRWPAFSPDGLSLAFGRGRTDFHVHTLPLTAEGAAVGEPRKLTGRRLFLNGLEWMPAGNALLIGAIIDSGWWRLWKISAEPEQVAPVPLQIEPGHAQHPSIGGLKSGSPGARLAYTSYSSDHNIYRIAGPSAPEAERVARQPTATRIIGSSRHDTAPQFSPDGNRIVFVSDRSGSFEVWVANADGSNQKRVTFFGGPPVGSPRWSPDSRRISFDAAPEGHSDVYIVNPDSGVPRRLTSGDPNEGRSSWSRDGRWIYFASDRDGPPDIWKTPVAGGRAFQITRNQGLEAFESMDGKWLYYTKRHAGRGDAGVWRLPVGGGPEEIVISEGVAGRWALGQSGIYLLNPGGEGRPPAIEKVFFESWNRTTVHEFPNGSRFGTANSLAVSANDRWILCVQHDRSEADLMLVENFR
jgi:Tol biopolymer transport system component